MEYLIVYGLGIITGWWFANKVRDGKNPIQELQNLVAMLFKPFIKKKEDSK